MAETIKPSEFLFSYGTLWLETVQLSTFGRKFAGIADVLVGFELGSVKIEDLSVVANSGKTVHSITRFTGNKSNAVAGIVSRTTPRELANADEDEVAAYTRIAVILHSGRSAWVYVDAKHAPSRSP